MVMRNSRARMAFGLMCLVLAALRFEQLAWVLPVLGLLLALGGSFEIIHLMRMKSLPISEPMAYAATVLIYLIGLVPSDIFPWLLALVLTGIIMGAFVAHLARHSFEGALQGVGASLLPALYVGLALACGIQILRVDRMFFLFVLVCVWAMDSAAYYFGCTYGRRRLAARISPKKSWEGAIAGLLGSVLVAVAAKILFALDLEWISVVSLGVAFAVMGQLGDLAESALKRDAGVKDSGAAFGGHGGVLDRVDSLLFCFMTFYIWLLATNYLEKSSMSVALAGS
ncbi:MAG: phosphatidate cytidylyltransferase [Candidatus Sumerlaeaceae bacterium]|nr:phosphatidate cytidylyltransferase [Candidatus Sumerlaeaceae bacterium]